MIAEVTYPGGPIKATIKLPASKSISNRVLIIHALGKLHASIAGLSEAADTLQMRDALLSRDAVVDAGDGGTTLRFLMAYYCATGKAVTLTASAAMKKRPVVQLVEALRQLGASVEYADEDGKLPVIIGSRTLTGKTIVVDGAVSSQFISALMLIGPYIPGGITIEITGEVLSVPYIKMTQSVMEYFGAQVHFDNAVVHINEAAYQNRDILIEPDWSAASYWYEMAALNDQAEIHLQGLSRTSLQGDAVIAAMMTRLGVESVFSDATGCTLKHIPYFELPDYFSDDFTGCPDLAPAVAVTCAGLNLTADLHGLKNFRLKESDRAAALQRELYNLNVNTDFCGGSKFKLYRGKGIKNYSRPLKAYNDHRIAMALAPVALKTGKVFIEDCEVVEKSYPGFFEDLSKAGFQIIIHPAKEIISAVQR